KMSLSIALLVSFYQLVLRRLTFYSANRYFLLGAGLCSLLFPLINLSSFFVTDISQAQAIINWVPSTEAVTSNLIPLTNTPDERTGEWSLSLWLVVLWIAGALFIFLRMLLALVSLVRLHFKSSVVLV